MLRRYVALTIIILMALATTSCGGDSPIAGKGNEANDKLSDKENEANVTITGKEEAYDIIAGRIDYILDTLPSDSTSSPLIEEFSKASDEEKSLMALEMADDMAMAQSFGVVTDDMIVMAGNAVKAYPHPLLLNNYATMLTSSGNNEDALFFFLQAFEQEPDNPVLLTNIANIYILIGDFGAAEQYATKALRVTNDFGPAYQVLTTVHLHNNNSELAAETMVKSAKHCFNEITISHFDSFLYAVLELDPAVDEYPLKEEFIAELYEIAKVNVDTKDVNNSVDTPEWQVKIKPFPQITSAENLKDAYSYLDEEIEKLNTLSSDARINQDTFFDDIIFEYAHPDNYSEEYVYPIRNNLRQMYAFKILQSYCEFKLDQCKSKYDAMLEDININASRDWEVASKSYSEKCEELKASDDLDDAKQLA